MKKKIIILGGLGYLGTEISNIYSGESWYNEIVVLDKKFLSERVHQLKIWNIKYINEDILNLRLLKKILKDFDIIHHLAGITEVPYLKSQSNYNNDKEILAMKIKDAVKIQNLRSKVIVIH